MSDLPSTIARVLEIDAAGTPGPWVHTSTDTGDSVDAGPALQKHVALAPYRSHPYGQEDCALIAYYRTAAPLLARECERLTAHIELAIQSRNDAHEESRRLSDVARTVIADRDTARAVLTRIAATMSCEPDDDADLVEAVRLLVVERDTARAEVEQLRADLAMYAAAWVKEGK